jgi:hypothetical protein
VNKSVDNKEESTYRRAKQSKVWEKHKRKIGYVKNSANIIDNTETNCMALVCCPWGEWKPLPERNLTPYLWRSTRPITTQRAKLFHRVVL